MEFHVRNVHHIQHSDTTVHAEVEMLIGDAGTDSPEQVYTVHATVIAIYAFRCADIAALHMAFS